MTQPPKNTRAIPQEAFDWYDDYAHGKIDRRTFLARLAGLSALGFSAAMISQALLPNYAQAEQVSFNDPDIKAQYQSFPSSNGHGEGRGYLVAPSNIRVKAPTVLVIHENRGLNPYIKDVARRLAKQGFIAFAPDALHPVGGYPGNDDEGRKLQRAMDAGKLEADFIAAARYVKQFELSSGQLGAVGFCYGGYIVNMLAARMAEELDAGVAFYGTPAAAKLRDRVRGPLMLHFAELDARVNQTWPDYQQTLEAANAQYVAHHYANANHGFHNDSTARYDQDAAELAWMRTLAFFDEHLRPTAANASPAG